MDASIVFVLNRIATRSRASRLATRLLATYVPVLMVAVFFVFCFAQFTFSLGATWFIKAVGISIVARLVGTVIRLFIHRPRPFRSHRLKPLITHTSLSFPSGHALFFSAFSVVVFTASAPLGVAFFAATAVVCIARVAAGVHYPSDMLLGVIIGAVSGLLILHF